MTYYPNHKPQRGDLILNKNSKQIFMSQLKDDGTPDKIKCLECGKWVHALERHNISCNLNKQIEKTRLRLHYVTHKDEVNQRRKKNKRQSWAERADNPANKRGKM